MSWADSLCCSLGGNAILDPSRVQELCVCISQFEVTKVRRVVICTDNVEPFKIEKVWQTMEDGRVVTCCATSVPIPFLRSGSVLEVWGVNPEIDGLHIVDEVFHEGYDLAYSSVCFFGCELVGDKVDDDIYLICDWTGVHNKSSSWAAQLWRVENKGLYHVRLVLAEDCSAGCPPEISGKINPCANEMPILSGELLRRSSADNSAHSLSQMNHNSSVYIGARRVPDASQRSVSECTLGSEAGEGMLNVSQHTRTEPPEVIFIPIAVSEVAD